MGKLVTTHLNRVDQSGASSQGDIIAGDKTEKHYHGTQKDSVIGELTDRLAREIESNQQVRELVEHLQYFYVRHAPDGVVGLENKLKKAGRGAHDIHRALVQKELFVKLLEKWSLYASAQEIFAYLLAKAEQEFRISISPQLSSHSSHEIDSLVAQKIVTPIVDELGAGVFNLNAASAAGMVYWLAEQCFVRWHV